MDPAQATGEHDEQPTVPAQRGSRDCIEGLQSAQAAPMNGRTGIISSDLSADNAGGPAPAAAEQPTSLGSYGAHGKHVVSAMTLILAASLPVPFNFSLTPPPHPPPPHPQHHNGCIYAVAHVRSFDCVDEVQDGQTIVDIDAGFEVAPGDASDIEVANAHPWGSLWLVFSDGAAAATALYIAKHPSFKGKPFT